MERLKVQDMVVFEAQCCEGAKKVDDNSKTDKPEKHEESSVSLLFQNLDQPKILLFWLFLKVIEHNPKVVPDDESSTPGHREDIPHRILYMKEVICDIALVCVFEDEAQRNGTKEKYALERIEEVFIVFFLSVYVKQKHRYKQKAQLEIELE